MKSIKKLPVAIAFLIIFMMSITPSYAQLPAAIDTEPSRDEIVWGTGSGDTPTHINPWSNNPSPFSQLMFETLFGQNTEKHVMVPCIGTDYTWVDGGRNLTININPHAIWSNGDPIDTNDVVKSYDMAQYQEKWDSDFPKRFVAFHEISPTQVIFEVHANATYSKRVIDWISTDIPILPWDGVYEEINATYASSTGSLATFTNDWWDPSYNTTWKVCSGPYAPVYRDNSQTTSVYQRRDDWWGDSSTFELYPDLPNWRKKYYPLDFTLGPPKYVGCRMIEDDNAKNAAFRTGSIDLHSGYYADFEEDIQKSGPGDFFRYAKGWYLQEAPYQIALSSPINVAFNHEYGAPLNESWFREAMAWMINYDPIPDAATQGYTRRSEATFLDSLSSVHKPYFNESLADRYRRSFNYTKAAEILTANNCTGNIGGTWTLSASLGGGTIGPFTMICPLTWTDVRIFTEFVCNDFTNFGITVTYEPVDTDVAGGWETWVSRWMDRDYTLGMSSGEPKVIESPEIFFNGWRDDPDWNVNITGWHSLASQEFESLYIQLETENNTVKYQYILDEIQRIFCEEIPEIPCFVNGYWYTYSDWYWNGWTNAINNYQQIITEWTNNQIPMITRMILNLVSAGRGSGCGCGDLIPWSGLEIFIILGFVSTIVLTGYRIRKRK
ncbi:MAG: hypothetical protein KGD63_00985 [Candidatus Lokiarchaeota archaeon]|nr:hypothetical protein [Candidatus Lokiarchaeota archaeon]